MAQDGERGAWGDLLGSDLRRPLGAKDKPVYLILRPRGSHWSVYAMVCVLKTHCDAETDGKETTVWGRETSQEATGRASSLGHSGLKEVTVVKVESIKSIGETSRR